MSPALISVIMPIYNSAEYIEQSINSVLTQSYEKIELIIIDDSSTDNGVDIVKKIMDFDNRIQLILMPENQGAGSARNKGIDVANGRYIAFLDADDVWLPAKLEKQIAFMQSKNIGISFTSYRFINSEGSDIRGGVNAANTLDLDSYMRTTGIGLSTAIIDKEVCGEIHFSSMRLRQDTLLWLTLLSKGYKAFGLNECLVKYRIRTGQISGNKLKAAWRTFFVYWQFDAISKKRRLANYFYYIINAVLKRFS